MKGTGAAHRLFLLLGVFVVSSLLLLFLPHAPGSNPRSIFLGDRVDFLVDMQARSDAEVLDKSDSLFTKSQGKLVNQGVAGGLKAPFWLRFVVPPLTEPTSQAMTLSFEETRVRAITLYVQKDGETRRFDYVAARIDPGINAPLRFFAQTLPAQEWAGATVTLKILTLSSKRAVLWLEPEEVSEYREARQLLFFGLLFGIQLALFVYLIGMGLSLRDPAQISLGLLTFVYCLNVMADRAFIETVLFPGHVWLARYISIASTFLAFAAWLSFLRAYLQVSRWAPWLASVLKWWIIADVVLALAALVDNYFDLAVLRLFSAQIGLAGIALGLFTALFALVRNTMRGIVFLAAWLPSLSTVAARLIMDARPGTLDSLVPVQAVYIGLIIGLLTFAIVLSLDIRDREVALRRRAEANAEKLRDYAAAASDGFFETDRTGLVAEYSGASAQAFVAGAGQGLLARADGLAANADSNRLVRQSLEFGLPFRAVLIKVPDEAGERTFELSGTPVAEGFRGIVTDVTAREQAKSVREREIRFASIGQLAGNLAHDINNLLHPIISLSRRVRDRLADDDAGRRYLDNVTRAGERASTVVSRFLSSAHGSKDFGQRMTLPDAIREIGADLLPIVDDRCRITLDIADGPAPEVLVSDAYQLVSNLVSNAVHACEGGDGDITISLSQKAGEELRLTVRDTGCGMDAAALARLNEPGFTTRPRGIGSGLGLGIVREIAARWGARLDVQSAPGAGTSVCLIFPPP